MFRTVMFLAVFLVSSTCLALGSDADELRAKAKALRKEASANADRGNKEAAEQLEREAVELLEAAEQIEGEDRPGVDTKARRLKERLHELRRMQDTASTERELTEVGQQIAKTELELHRIHAGPNEQHADFHAQAEKLANASRRIHHMRVAAENLKLAEMHDLAIEVIKKADAMERDVHEAKHRLALKMHENPTHRDEQVPEFVRDLRAEIERLRAEVRELRERVEKQ